MEAQFTCPRCRLLLGVPASAVGKRALCPSCSSVYRVITETVPAAVAPRPAPAPAPRVAPRESPRPRPARPRTPVESWVEPKAPPKSRATLWIMVASVVGILAIAGYFFLDERDLLPWKWQELVSKEGGFRVSMPGEATRQEILPGAGKVKMASYEVQTKAHYKIEFLQAGKGLGQFGVKDMEQLILATLPAGYKIRTSRDVFLGQVFPRQNSGRELVIDGPETVLVMRIFYANNRMYVLRIEGIDLAQDSYNVKKFMNSFHLLRQ